MKEKIVDSIDVELVENDIVYLVELIGDKDPILRDYLKHQLEWFARQRMIRDYEPEIKG